MSVGASKSLSSGSSVRGFAFATRAGLGAKKGRKSGTSLRAENSVKDAAIREDAASAPKTRRSSHHSRTSSATAKKPHAPQRADLEKKPTLTERPSPRDLVVVEDEDGRAIRNRGKGYALTKREKHDLEDVFGNRVDSIMELLDGDDMDGAQALIYRALLRSLVTIVPVLERNVKRSKGQKGAYQYNQTLSQLRESMADIQAMRDKGNLGMRVVEKFVRPSYLDIASHLAIAIMQIENSLTPYMTKDNLTEFQRDVLGPLKMEMSRYMRAQLESVTQNVAQALS